MFAAAIKQAEGTGMLQVELRATYSLALEHQAAGELAEAAQIAQLGERRAHDEGLGLAPYGMDMRHLHFQARFLAGQWEHAQRLADGFPVRVTSLPEAVLSAMALFIDVARGNPAVEERRTWLEPFWNDGFVGYVARSLLAEQALWRGDTDLALSHAEAAIRVSTRHSYKPSALRPAAVALAARADRAVAARAAGDADAEAAELAGAKELLDVAREGARFPALPKAVLGSEGRGWIARAEAEYRRASGHNAPEAWDAVLSAFGPQYAYETARAQWRLAEALIEAGRAGEAVPIWRAAAATATQLGAAPLSAALEALARRARLDPGRRRRPGPGRVGQRLSDRIAYRPRARCAPAALPGPVQPPDRRGAVHLAQDRQRARLQHSRQAGRHQPHRSRRDRPPRGPLTRTTPPATCRVVRLSRVSRTALGGQRRTSEGWRHPERSPRRSEVPSRRSQLQ